MGPESRGKKGERRGRKVGDKPGHVGKEQSRSENQIFDFFSSKVNLKVGGKMNKMGFEIPSDSSDTSMGVCGCPAGVDLRFLQILQILQ